MAAAPSIHRFAAQDRKVGFVNLTLKMIKQFRDMLLDVRIKFPLKKNIHGYYQAEYTDKGHELRCPNCGGTLWSIKSYQHIECFTCYKNFSNLGVYGLKEIPEHPIEVDN
jgi:hypothetical protein